MKLVNKGEILSDSVDDIYDIIFREYTHKGFCDVDFEGVKAITTKFAGKLFGRLYDNLGKEEFYIGNLAVGELLFPLVAEDGQG